ncbi:MAG: protein kinase [Bacteroidales bacterium]|nr:protein kinase [Bacteroidales bacterium]
MIPQIFKAITKLHEYKIYHCDLKPQNILYLDETQNDLVIGDYGSAKAWDLQSEMELRRSKIVKGTEAYLAPEQARGITSEKNDYYSFGMILLHLLYPEQICTSENFSEIDKEKFSILIEKQYNGGPLVKFSPEYERLNRLITGLTMAYYHDRWGWSEVEAWLKGKFLDAEAGRKQLVTDENLLIVDGIEIHNVHELALEIENRSDFIDVLLEDEDNFSALKTWLIQTKDIAYKNKLVNIIAFHREMGKKYLKDALNLFLGESYVVNYEGVTLNLAKSNDLSHEINTLRKDMAEWNNSEKELAVFFRVEFILRLIAESPTAKNNKTSTAILHSLIKEFKIDSADVQRIACEITKARLIQTQHAVQEFESVGKTQQNKGFQKQNKENNKTLGIKKQADADRSFQQKINIFESEANGIRFYGHYSTEAAMNYAKAWYFYFFYTEAESRRFNQVETMAAIKKIIVDNGWNEKEMNHYAIYSHNSKATRMQLESHGLQAEGFNTQSAWSYVDLEKRFVFYSENGFNVPVNAENIALIQRKNMLLKLFVVYPLMDDSRLPKKKAQPKLSRSEHVTKLNYPLLCTSKNKYADSFFSGEFDTVLNFVDTHPSRPIECEKVKELGRFTVSDALLQYFLYLKYNRKDGIREINNGFSMEAYCNKINNILSQDKSNSTEITIENIRMAIDEEYEKIKVWCQDWCKKNSWIVWYPKKNYRKTGIKMIDFVTLYNGNLYSAYRCVTTNKLLEAFNDLLEAYNKIDTMLYFGIYDIENKWWYYFGDTFVTDYAAYYTEMKYKYDKI